MPLFHWKYKAGTWVLVYRGHIEDDSLGTPIALIQELSGHVHAVSPLMFINKGCANSREAMIYVQQQLIDFCAAVAMTSDPNFPNRHWPVAT